MLSSVYLLTYKKVTFNNGVSFMQTNISVSFTVVGELQWNETSIKYSNLANLIHWCGTLNPKVSKAVITMVKQQRCHLANTITQTQYVNTQ